MIDKLILKGKFKVADIFKSGKIAGIRYKEHETRKPGRQKDEFYAMRYQRDKKQIQEYLGWASQGWTEEKASKILARIKENIKTGTHPQSLAEMRTMNEEAAKKQEEKKLKRSQKRLLYGKCSNIWEYIKKKRAKRHGKTRSAII